jgi:hypothetical protein
MGRGQSQGGQLGGMGQPGGVPGGGIASLAPQVGGQMGGFGQMMNQAVVQPGMAQPGMAQPGMAQPGMGERSIGDMTSFFQPPQQGSQTAPAPTYSQQPTAANASAMNQFNLRQSQAQGTFGAPGAPGMGPPGMQRPQGGMGVARPQGLASMMGGFRR